MLLKEFMILIILSLPVIPFPLFSTEKAEETTTTEAVVNAATKAAVDAATKAAVENTKVASEIAVKVALLRFYDR